MKLATVVKGDPKAPFSIATTPRCRGGHYSIPWIVPLYPCSWPYNAVLSKAASSTIFWVFGMMRPGIEPRSPGSLANKGMVFFLNQLSWLFHFLMWSLHISSSFLSTFKSPQHHKIHWQMLIFGLLSKFEYKDPNASSKNWLKLINKIFPCAVIGQINVKPEFTLKDLINQHLNLAINIPKSCNKSLPPVNFSSV